MRAGGGVGQLTVPVQVPVSAKVEVEVAAAVAIAVAVALYRHYAIFGSEFSTETSRQAVQASNSKLQVVFQMPCKNILFLMNVPRLQAATRSYLQLASTNEQLATCNSQPVTSIRSNSNANKSNNNKNITSR